MEVFALFFSPTENTKKAVRAVAKGIAKEVSGEDFFSIDLTCPEGRHSVYAFGEGDVIILGMPTYAGRIPNKIVEYVSGSIYGDGAVAVPVVTFGNRSFDDSLKELATIMTDNGMDLCGACAVPSEHAFSDKLAKGCPTESDLQLLSEYGRKLGKEMLKGNTARLSLDDIPGRDMETSEYYKPLKEDGTPASFLKAMPVTDTDKCTGCGLCKEVCPTNCFKDSFSNPDGVCIKCQACIKSCPQNAKYFENANFLSHVKMLEKNFSDVKHEITKL